MATIVKNQQMWSFHWSTKIYIIFSTAMLPYYIVTHRMPEAFIKKGCSREVINIDITCSQTALQWLILVQSAMNTTSEHCFTVVSF